MRSNKLKGLFSTFPGGWPGLGLLLLRGAVGINLLVSGGGYLVDLNSPTLGRLVFGLLAVAIGAFILIGFVTPIAGILASFGGVGIVLSWFPPPSSLLVARPVILLEVTIAIAIVLLGPGAFSLDARLFGRREITIPRAQRSPKS